MKYELRSSVGRGCIYPENRYIGRRAESLETLEYKVFGRVLMVDNVVNWYMGATRARGLGVMSGLV